MKILRANSSHFGAKKILCLFISILLITLIFSCNEVEANRNKVRKFLKAVTDNNPRKTYEINHPGFVQKKLPVQEYLFENSRFEIVEETKSRDGSLYDYLIRIENQYPAAYVKNNRHAKILTIKISFNNNTKQIINTKLVKIIDWFQQEDNKTAIAEIKNLLREKRIIDAVKVYRMLSADELYYDQISSVRDSIIASVKELSFSSIAEKWLKVESMKVDISEEYLVIDFMIKNKSNFFHLAFDICIDCSIAAKGKIMGAKSIPARARICDDNIELYPNTEKILTFKARPSSKPGNSPGSLLGVLAGKLADANVYLDTPGIDDVNFDNTRIEVILD